MFARVGWKPGEALGTTSQQSGLIDPIEAVMRQRKRGLGA